MNIQNSLGTYTKTFSGPFLPCQMRAKSNFIAGSYTENKVLKTRMNISGGTGYWTVTASDVNNHQIAVEMVGLALSILATPNAANAGCRKSGLRHFFEVFIAPLRLRRGQGAMQRNPCYARLFADLPYTPPNPIIASGGQSRAPPVAGGARRKPSEQGSARKAPRADAARPLRTALRPPNPQGFLDKLRPALQCRYSLGEIYVIMYIIISYR